MQDTKQINCPEHPGQHTATLFCAPHEYAGIWECPTGASDEHDHAAAGYDTEVFTVDTMRNGEHDQYEETGYVCALDGTPISSDVADPALDRAEALAEMRD
jgi:hypothetical protein